MYTAFYGLREKPFALSPDPRFLYLAGSHREALAHLLYGIEQGEGFISITGEVGTGKTTLCRTLLERLDDDLELAFLFNPSRTALELLQSICAEFDLPAEGLTRRSLMTQLNNFLVEQKRIGRRVLLIIDEAQTLSENTLEQVRLLSNLETSREKLIQILLLGQPELDRKLDERGLRQLRQRISVRWQLDPLGPQETRAYVRHRLSVAAGEPKDLFSESALREVHLRTGGVPRLVNQLCDRALLAGYASRAAQIGPRLVRAAAREIPDARHKGHRGTRGNWLGSSLRPWMIFSGSLALVAVSLFAGLQVGRGGLKNSMQASIFKPAALGDPGREQARPVATAAESNPGIPLVGANAPLDRIGPSGGLLVGPAQGPPLAELIGYVPSTLREELRPSVGQLGALNPSGVVASDVSLAIPDLPSGLRPETALATGLLAQILANRNGQSALSESREVLLEQFGRQTAKMAPAPADGDALARSIVSRGLMATVFDGGSIDLLRSLDHPVALPLSVRPTRGGTRQVGDPERWVAITGFKNDRALVAGLISNQIVTVEIVELERHWLETGMIVWEKYESLPEVMLGDDEGPGVLWIQRSLAELRLLSGSPSGRFDAATVEAVARFQRSRGLAADGVAGPLTQIALYSQLARYPVPRLSRFAESEAALQTQSRAAVSRGDGVPDAAENDSPRTSPAGTAGERG